MELTLLIFIIFAILIIGLQLLNNYFLKQIFNDKYHHLIVLILLSVHVPLVLYATIRLIGGSNTVTWLQPLAWATIYFQLLTLMNILVWCTFSTIWTLIKPWRTNYIDGRTDAKRKKYLQKTSIIGILLAICCVTKGIIEAKTKVDITHHELSFQNLPPGLDGLKIVQISDLHAGPMATLKQLQYWRQLVEKEQPEILLITGDIVDSLAGEAKIVAEAFHNFHTPLGCFAILGNHDYFTDPNPIWDALSNAGIHSLENSNVIVSRNGDQLALLGLQDPMASKKHILSGKTYGVGPQPILAVKNIPNDIWRICLSHRPEDWHLAKQTGALLTLSGHTHGGQVNLLPGISSAILLGKYTHGLYKEWPYQLYVSRGLGSVTLPIRIGAYPEITVITLKRG